MTKQGETLSDTEGVLADIPLFSKLGENSLLALARDARWKRAEKGDILFFNQQHLRELSTSQMWSPNHFRYKGYAFIDFQQMQL